MKIASLCHRPTTTAEDPPGGDGGVLLGGDRPDHLLADDDREDGPRHHDSRSDREVVEAEAETAAATTTAPAAAAATNGPPSDQQQQEPNRHQHGGLGDEVPSSSSTTSTGIGGSGSATVPDAVASGQSRSIGNNNPNHHNGVNYLAPPQCFKKKKGADRTEDENCDGGGDGHGDPHAGASSLEDPATTPPKGNGKRVSVVLDPPNQRNGSIDDVDDIDIGASAEVPSSSSSPPPSRKPPKPAPPTRRSTTTTLATMESGSDDDDLYVDETEGLREGTEGEEDNAAGIPGTLELRDVGNEDDDEIDNDQLVGGGEGVEVTIRQYVWKQRWDRFYYGFLRRRKPTIALGGCYAGAKVVGDDGAARQRRRSRLVPVLVAVGVATVLLVIVAAGSACGSGRCGASKGAVPSSSSANSPDNNNPNNNPPFGDTTSASPASAPSSSGAPVTAPSETPSPTPLDPNAADNPWMDRTPEPTWAKSNPVTLTSTTDLYCYPSYSDRARYSNVWPSSTTSTGYTIEAKEGSYCGPGNNHFSSANVNFDEGDNVLVLQYRQVNGLWTGSEVRVVLPDDLMPYTYGTYAFSVRNVSFTDAMGQPKNGNVLSEDLVVGFFTWDDTERYDVHENWNHEVDVELSRWGDPSNEDAQFVIQPPEVPHYHRFFSGAGSTLNPGGQSYQFTGYPTNVTWHASGTGESYAYTTRMALEQNLPDRIQCLPANVEVRMNIWNLKGADATPTGMSETDVVHVVIDNFSFTPVGMVGVDDGQLCSKHCQCSGETSLCVASVCTPA